VEVEVEEVVEAACNHMSWLDKFLHFLHKNNQ
jgi:hypothetical protein